MAGHNVIIYNMDERSQHFIPGTEGTEGINTICLSASGKFLAVCETGERAHCMIYEIPAHKLRKRIPEYESHGGSAVTELDYKCKQFLSAAFDPKLEAHRLITLCGKDDWCILLWRWDLQKVLSKVNLNLLDPNREGDFQLSF